MQIDDVNNEESMGRTEGKEFGVRRIEKCASSERRGVNIVKERRKE